MLVLIVVIAASSFAIFMSEKQKETQDQQMRDLERSLEKVQILSINTVNDTQGRFWVSFNITLANLYTGETTINRISLNDLGVAKYTVLSSDPYSGRLVSKDMSGYDDLTIAAREQVNIIINVTDSDALFAPPTKFPTTGYIKVGVLTARVNEFSRAFVPPSAVGQLVVQQQWNGTGFETYLILDGTKSTAHDGSYLVSWEWSVKAGDGTVEDFTKVGAMVRCDFKTNETIHNITLTVIDNYNMKASCIFTYYY